MFKFRRGTLLFALHDSITELKDQLEVSSYVEDEEVYSVTKNAKHKNNVLSIAHLTSIPTGGAGIATESIHRALLARGDRSCLFTSFQASPIVRGYVLSDPKYRVASVKINRFFTKEYVTPESTSLTIETTSLQKEYLQILDEFDIIHLHATARFLSSMDISHILDLGKPVVWTAHDMYPITGGCHTHHGCTNWTRKCEECPQLKPEKRWYSELAFDFKRRYLDRQNLTLVAVSKTGEDLFRRSPLFSSGSVEMILNPVDLDAFYPTDFRKERAELGIDEDTFVVCYSATYGRTLKGFADVEAVARKLAKARDKFLLLVVGGKEIDVDPAFCKQLGFIEERNELRRIYVASDVTLIASSEEMFPNTAAESVACGTPVVGYEVGILPMLASAEGVGHAVPIGDVAALCDALLHAPLKSERSNHCRDFALEHFSPSKVAEQYRDLYERSRRNTESVCSSTPKIPSNLMSAVYGFAAEALCAEVQVNSQLRQRVQKLKASEQRANKPNASEQRANKPNASKQRRLEARLKAMQESTSWRITKPLRYIMRALRIREAG